MKKQFYHPLLSAILLVFAYAIGGYQLFAQQADEGKQKIRIEVKTTENGDTTLTVKEITADEGTDINTILEEMGVADELNVSEKGEKVEVTIKRKKIGGAEKNIDIDVHPRPHPAPHVKKWAEKRAMLGVYIETVGGGLNGAVVQEVIENSAAEKAQILEGDIITSFDGQPVYTSQDLIELVRKKNAGDEVEIELERDGRVVSVTATLGEKQEMRSMMIAPYGDGGFDFEMKEFNGNMEEFEQYMEDLQEEMERLHENGDLPEEFEFYGSPHHMPHLKSKAFLGVSPDVKKSTEAVVLGEVHANSAAEEMGLQAGDIILEVNNESIESFAQLAELVGKMEPGDPVDVVYERNGEVHRTSGNLKERKAPVIHKKREHFFPGETLEKEIKVSIMIEEVSAEEAKKLNEKADVGIKPESDLSIRTLQFAPNPSNGQFELSFQLPKKEKVELRVMDSNGRLVYHEILDDFSGNYRNNINISNEPAGAYFLVITQGGEQFSRKVIKQ